MRNKPLQERYDVCIENEPMAVGYGTYPLLESMKTEIEKLEVQLKAVRGCQRYTAESFIPKNQFVQFTTQPNGKLMLAKDVLAAALAAGE
jgi:hypothetical protein